MKKCHFLDSLTYVVYVEKVGGTYKKCSGTSEGIQKDSKIQGNVEISTILPYTINKLKKKFYIEIYNSMKNVQCSRINLRKDVQDVILKTTKYYHNKLKHFK